MTWMKAGFARRETASRWTAAILACHFGQNPYKRGIRGSWPGTERTAEAMSASKTSHFKTLLAGDMAWQGQMCPSSRVPAF